MLDVGDLVDLAGGLAVPARALVRIGNRLPGNGGELAAHGAEQGLLGHDVGEKGPEPVGPCFEAGQLGARLEALVEDRRDLGEDCLRGHPRNHLQRRLADFLNTAKPDEDIGAPGADIDQLALEVSCELVEIGGARVQVEPQAHQRSARDPDVDVTRRRGSLRGSHPAIIAGR